MTTEWYDNASDMGAHCAACGNLTPIRLLDAKPSDLRPGETLTQAADRGADFDRLECQACYGPEWLPV